MYIGLYVKNSLFLSDFNETSNFSTYFRKTLKYQISLQNKNQLDATYYFIVLLIDSTCFWHYYAHHQELATIMLITTLVGHYSNLTAPNLQPTANQERNDQRLLVSK